MTQMYYMERNKNKLIQKISWYYMILKRQKNNTEYYENVKG